MSAVLPPCLVPFCMNCALVFFPILDWILPKCVGGHCSRAADLCLACCIFSGFQWPSQHSSILLEANAKVLEKHLGID